MSIRAASRERALAEAMDVIPSMAALLKYERTARPGDLCELKAKREIQYLPLDLRNLRIELERLAVDSEQAALRLEAMEVVAHAKTVGKLGDSITLAHYTVWDAVLIEQTHQILLAEIGSVKAMKLRLDSLIKDEAATLGELANVSYYNEVYSRRPNILI
jgi:hypothetical protein